MTRSPSATHDTEPALLHWTQKFFWFSAAMSLLFATSRFAWRVWQGRQLLLNEGTSAAIAKFGASGNTCSRVPKDRLIAIRGTTLNDAASTHNMQRLEKALPDLFVTRFTKSLASRRTLSESNKVFWDSGSGYGYCIMRRIANTIDRSQAEVINGQNSARNRGRKNQGHHLKGARRLHWCQKLFLRFAAGLSLLLTTSSFRGASGKLTSLY